MASNTSGMDATTWANTVDHAFFIILNVGMGGSWPGSPASATQSGAPMLVDYVHVYTTDGIPTPTTPHPLTITHLNSYRYLAYLYSYLYFTYLYSYLYLTYIYANLRLYHRNLLHEVPPIVAQVLLYPGLNPVAGQQVMSSCTTRFQVPHNKMSI